MSRNSSASYQLPELASILRHRGYAVRANRNCKQVSDASLSWAQESQLKSDSPLRVLDLEKIKRAKLGLLSSAAFSSCDAFQLRVATDMWTLLYSFSELRPMLSQSEDLLQMYVMLICRASSANIHVFV